MKRDQLFSRVDIPAAFGLLTRIPIPNDSRLAMKRGAAVVWAFPLVGALIGAIAGTTHTIATLVGLPHALAAGLAICVLVMLTGALHEDGLADTADGFFGGWTKEVRLEIMKDSRIGAFGVLALIMTMGLRFGGAVSLPSLEFGWALVSAAMISRAAMAALWAALPAVRRGGLTAVTGRPTRAAVVIGAVIAIALSLCILPAKAVLVATFFGVLAVSIVGIVAFNKIGGQTGDILGAAQVCAELAILLSFVSILT